jgi:phage tail sheath protein FI
MPEYLAPGVFVEETSFRAKSIEGVSTTITGFVGPTRYGPIDLPCELLTSVLEFERAFGSRAQLVFDETNALHNYVWHGVRAFFEEGGNKLYVTRVFRRIDNQEYDGFDETDDMEGAFYKDGHARAELPRTASASSKDTLKVHARYPGASGNARVSFRLDVGQNILASTKTGPTVAGLLAWDVVMILSGSTPATTDVFNVAEWDGVNGRWQFRDRNDQLTTLDDFPAGTTIQNITLSVEVIPLDDPDSAQIWSDLALDSRHATLGAKDSVQEQFLFDPDDPTKNRSIPIVIDAGSLDKGLEVLNALLDADAAAPAHSPLLEPALEDPESTPAQRTIELVLQGGNDGTRPSADDYEGRAEVTSTLKSGLKQFEDLEDISIVAAPGSTFGLQNGYADDGKAIIRALITHCEAMKYRIAVLDSGNGQTVADVRQLRGELDSKYAALYYPWIKVLDPLTRVPIVLPPSGFVAGIYARNDINRAVYKAPANEVVNLAMGFEVMLNKSQQEVLNPDGVNAFRFFEGRGYRLWGARTISSDPEWKYVNLRRYFAYLERSIDKGTQWAVFEPNGDQLWANVRRTISDFLFNEWSMGALLGDKPETAYFVKCDRSTMTQDDLDNGRLVCLIGVAPLKPAEFVIFRIGQWTGDRR